MYLAHQATPAHPLGQPLEEHLNQVARRAAGFCSGPLAAYAEIDGRYHDAGKAQQKFQDRLAGSTDPVDHATPGAILLFHRLREDNFFAPLLLPPILGHHGGLPDGSSARVRLNGTVPREVSDAYPEQTPLDLPRPSVVSPATYPMELYLTVKLLHSALVDADYLDTEQYYSPEESAKRGRRPPLSALRERYDAHMRKILSPSSRSSSSASGHVNGLREEIRQNCLRAAAGPQGFFSLTVPTGGGKTLASLGFALYHAAKHPHIERIVYAIPFRSIVEQNADVFRQALGADAVLEHHSGVRFPEAGSGADHAAENWAAPVVVTTNVQLFESLFSDKPSRCRKLHNLQNSVLILDEMQALPDALLKPCLDMLDALVKIAHVTVVMCTATQPRYDSLWKDKPAVTEIIPDPPALFAAMKRTYAVDLGKLGTAALAERLRQHPQALCIVNSRAYARTLAEELGGEEAFTYHLSTMMCPLHRSEKLALIRARLEDGLPCRIVSTSLIEAGVDINLPVVYREWAGLDSVAQAAGRCNRGGESSAPVPVYLFKSDGFAGPPDVCRLADITRTEIAPQFEDLLGMDALAQFFRLRFSAGSNLDKPQIRQDIYSHRDDLWFPYAEIAEHFEMIQSAGEPVFVPYTSEARGVLQTLAVSGPTAGLLRRLQPYGVTVYRDQKEWLLENHLLRERDGVLWLDVSPQQLPGCYSPAFGLLVGSEPPFLSV